MSSQLIQDLIDLFSKFPTIGPRTASRFVSYLIQLPEKDVRSLLNAIEELEKKIRLCGFCFAPFEKSGEKDLCDICSDKGRDRSLLCVVEKESDLASLEKTKRYKGLYFILGGTISTLRKQDIEKIRAAELIRRAKDPKRFGLEAEFQEIIIATNSTPEGEATGLYIERLLKKNLPDNRKMTRLGRGIPVGGELEYAGDETLSWALENRKQA